MAVTVTEVAKKSGVSKALVSRLFNNDLTLRISNEKRERILSVKAALNASQARYEQNSHNFAYNFVIPCMGKSVFDELHAHMETKHFQNLKSTLKEQGFRLSIALHEDSEGIKPFEELVQSPRYCDGLLLLGGITNKEIAELLIAQKFPHVSSDWDAEMYGLNTVFDNAGMGIYQAVQRLRELGHVHIGFLGRQRHHYPFFISAIIGNGLKIDEKHNCVSPMLNNPIPEKLEGWRAAAKESFGKWLDNGGSSTAMICHNDYGALGAIDAMRERGMEPGKDISIVGYDNMEEKMDMKGKPFLSTVDSDTGKIGKRLGELLLNQVLYNQKSIVHERLPVRFIERESVGRCHR